ncbi:oligosaccharide flippase family protein [Polaribacter atrinae]|uniref:oligosaccharide flippase family protein n=1 Tax=Polaribacter atrinae TaxID=1333662 RepID=UPI0030F52456
MSNKDNNTLQTFWVLAGSLAAFSFSIISSMILSRYFDKSDYGTYKQVMYVYSTFLIIFTLGLPKAFSYFLPRVEKNQAKSLISKINMVLITLGVLMSLFIFLGADIIASALNNKDLAKPLKYFALVPLFMLPTMGLEGILATYKRTKFLAYYNISTRILMLLCVVLPVLVFKGNVNSAIIGFTVASFFSFLLALYFKFLPLKNEVKNITDVKYKEILQYTIPIMFAGIWGIVARSSDQFFISRYFGNEVFADFANGSLELPFITMIISATAIVLSPIFSKKIFDNGENLKNEIITLWLSVFSKSAKLIYPLVIFFFCFADIFMVLLYGEKYVSSGIYFRIKLIVNLFTLIAYGPLILNIGGQKFYYKAHMYSAFIVVFLEWISVYTIKSPIAIALISVICQIGKIFVMLWFVSRYFKIKLVDLFPVKLIANLIIPSVLILSLTRYFMIEYFDNNIIILSVSALIYLLLMTGWIVYKKIDYYSIIKPILSKLKK